MVRKTLKIILDVVISVIFFLILAMLVDWVARKIFGTTTKTDGTTTVDFNGGVLLAITTILTIVFAVLFYKFLTKKSNKIEE